MKNNGLVFLKCRYSSLTGLDLRHNIHLILDWAAKIENKRNWTLVSLLPELQGAIFREKEHNHASTYTTA